MHILLILVLFMFVLFVVSILMCGSSHFLCMLSILKCKTQLFVNAMLCNLTQYINVWSVKTLRVNHFVFVSQQ